MKRKFSSEAEDQLDQAAATTAKNTPAADKDEQAENASSSDAATAPRNGYCEVCAANVALYTCPKCEVKTCCLNCVKIHKKELSCDGIRDRTKFIPLRKMTKMDFMSDYYFLEECTRFCEDRKYDCLKRFTRYNKVLPTHLFRLRNAASERKITLRFLLQNFTRHKENTTYYDWKLRKIFWRVAWVFANACGLQYADGKCSEDATLAQLLDKYVNPQSEELVPQKKALEYYQSVGVYGWKILLRAEGIKRSRKRFYVLDATKTLNENLAGKTIVEYPCIYLSYEAQPAGIEMIDSDEDVEEETKSYQESINQFQKQQWETTHTNDNVDDILVLSDSELKKKLATEKRRAERQNKREEFEQAPSNYMFADDKLWDMLSTSDEDEIGNNTEEE